MFLQLIRRAHQASGMMFGEAAALQKLRDLKLAVDNGVSDDELLDKVGVAY